MGLFGEMGGCVLNSTRKGIFNDNYRVCDISECFSSFFVDITCGWWNRASSFSLRFLGILLASSHDNSVPQDFISRSLKARMVTFPCLGFPRKA